MKTKHPTKKLDTYIERFIRLNNKIREKTARVERDFLKSAGDLSTSQIRILFTAHEHQPCPMSLLAEATQLTRGNMTQAVDKMIIQKLLKRSPSPDDRRVIHVELTAKGKKIIATHHDHIRELCSDWFAKLSHKEIELFLDVFDKLGEQR